MLNHIGVMLTISTLKKAKKSPPPEKFGGEASDLILCLIQFGYAMFTMRSWNSVQALQARLSG